MGGRSTAASAAAQPLRETTARLLAATADRLREYLAGQMPAGSLRDYYRWGLDPHQPHHQLFLQATGATQLANLAATLLAGLVDEAHWPALTPYLVRLNIYQVLEAVSDDLGMGVLPLADGGSCASGAQRDLLGAFNDAMLLRLRGDPTPARELLAGVTDAAAGCSLFAHSLAGATHRKLATAFVAAAATGIGSGTADAGTADAGTTADPSVTADAGTGAGAVPENPAGTGESPARAVPRPRPRPRSRSRPPSRPPRGRSVTDLESGLWAALVANIEAGAALADQMAGNLLGYELRDGLVNRYRAVSRTLSDRHLPLVELAATGAQATRAAPVLAYYIGAVADLAGPVPGLAGVVRDGTLPETLYDAAVLVRLLNDIGPGLLRPEPDQRAALLTALQQAHQVDPDGGHSIDGLLLATLPPALGSRLRKDLRYREFNVCLYGLRRCSSVPQAVTTLTADLDYFARLYALHRDRLDAALRRLADRLGDTRVPTLVERFVRFHERLYANPYDQPDGDYRS